ncbi:MAG: AMP-binding protein [Polyangiales bacterium]
MFSSNDTLISFIARWASERPHQTALRGKRNGEWYSVSYSDYWQNVQAISRAFISFGLLEGECVAFLGANYPEWVQLQFGVQAARGVPAPIYMTSTEEQLAYIVAHSRSKFAVVDDEVQLGRVLQAEREARFPKLHKIISFQKVETSDERVLSFDEVLQLGKNLEKTTANKRLEELQDDDTCLLIYTSGTTGVPKGVEIDHGGQLVVGAAVMDFYPAFLEEGRYKSLSYLPLTAQAEQCFTNVFTLITGGEASFCPDLSQLKDYLVDVRPTVFLGMPRVWEKFEAALQARLAEATGFRARLLKWARQTELNAFHEQVRRGDPSYMPLPRRLARSLVL